MFYGLNKFRTSLEAHTPTQTYTLLWLRSIGERNRSLILDMRGNCLIVQGRAKAALADGGRRELEMQNSTLGVLAVYGIAAHIEGSGGLQYGVRVGYRGARIRFRKAD